LRYRLVALDVDGTLFCKRHQVSPRTRAALAAVRDRGMITVIATGRTPQSALEISRQIGGGPVICCNGAAVLDEAGAYLDFRAVPGEAVAHTIAVARRFGALVHCYTPDGKVLDQPLAHALNTYQWLRLGETPLRSALGVIRMWKANRTQLVRRLDRWALSADRPPVLKLMLLGEPAGLPVLAEEVRREVPGVTVTSSGKGNLEINAAGVSKATGLAALGEKLGIPREEMIAFGDSDNDVDMLRYVGLGVAMGNAAAHVKAAADRVAPCCEEDGVACVLEEVCGR